MSTTDRAFIKAYMHDEAEAGPPAPHIDVSQTSRRAAPPSEERTAAADQVSDTSETTNASIPSVSQYIPHPHVAFTRPHVWQGYQRQRTARQANESGLRVIPNTDSESQAPQPLSVFKPVSVNREEFKPAFEVDELLWPPACDRLLAEGRMDLTGLGDELFHPGAEHGTSIAVTGLRRGDGTSTVTMCLARALAAQGRRVAIVDADFVAADLAEQLGLAPTAGWEAVLSGEHSLAEVMIASDRDGLALLPLTGAVCGLDVRTRQLQVSVSLGVLRQHYDVVLVDAGPLLEPGATAEALLSGPVRRTVVVANSRTSSPAELRDAAQSLVEKGCEVMGIVENFIVASAAPSLAV